MLESITVPLGAMAAMAGTALFTAVLPLTLALVFWRKWRGRWRFFLLGCVVFPLFAMGLEGAVNRAVLYGPLGPAVTGNLALYALFGGAMAGIFEETGRLAAFSLARRWSRGPGDALMYGAGHGGIEAVLLVGMTMVNNLLLCAALNQGGWAAVEALMGTGPLSQAQMAALAPLASTPAWMYLWSAFERGVAIVIHLSLSVLVYAAAERRAGRWFLLAVLLHAGVDACAIGAASFLPIVGIELIALAWAVGLALLARRVFADLKAAGLKITQTP